MEFVEKHPQIRWDPYYIAQHPNVTIDVLEKYFDKFDSEDMYYVSTAACVNMEYVETHPEYRWDACGLIENPNVTIKFIRDNPHYNWDIFEICRRGNIITPKDVYANKELFYNDCLNNNTSMTYDFIMKFQHKDMHELSLNTFDSEYSMREYNKVLEKAARKIWYDAWVPYWYKPGNLGYEKDINLVRNMLS